MLRRAPDKGRLPVETRCDRPRISRCENALARVLPGTPCNVAPGRTAYQRARLGREATPGHDCSGPNRPGAGRAGALYVYQISPHWLGGLGTRLWGIESAASAHVRCPRLKASQYQPIKTQP
jgi:hypothetical protein